MQLTYLITKKEIVIKHKLMSDKNQLENQYFIKQSSLFSLQSEILIKWKSLEV